MTKSKTWSLIVAASWLVAGNHASWAGPQSALDPYAAMSAPNPVKGKPAPAKNYKGKTTSAYDGLTTRGEGIGRSGKRLGQGVANKSLDSAHATGSLLMKGAKVLGHGVKHTGEKLADGSQTVIENVSTWPKNIGHGLSLTGSKIAVGSKAVGHSVVAGSEKLKDGTQAVAEKAAAAPRAMGHGIAGGAGKLKSGILPSSSKDSIAAESDAAVKASELLSASSPAYKAQVAENKPEAKVEERGLVSKTAALPKAAGHKALRTAGRVGEGTQVVGKKVVALPRYMGRGIGKLFGRGDDAPQATASGPVDQIH